MIFTQEFIPKEEPTTFEERWPFNLASFLEERWMYLVAIIIVIAIFIYARKRWRKRRGL